MTYFFLVIILVSKKSSQEKSQAKPTKFVVLSSQADGIFTSCQAKPTEFLRLVKLS